MTNHMGLPCAGSDDSWCREAERTAFIDPPLRLRGCHSDPVSLVYGLPSSTLRATGGQPCHVDEKLPLGSNVHLRGSLRILARRGEMKRVE